MKKRLCSILLVLVMAISLLPTAAFAAGGDFDVDIVATKFNTVKYNEKETMKLDFMMKTSNGAKVRGIQTALLAIDLNKYAVLQVGTKTVYDRTDTVSTGSTVTKNYAYTKYNDEANEIEVTPKNTFLKSGTTLLMTFEADFGANDVSITESTSMMSILLGLKDGVDWSNLPSDSIRLATAAEAKTFNATGVVTVNDSDGNAFVFRHKDGAGSDPLTIAPTLASDDSFSFVEPPKPPYSGDIAAPTVNSNAGGKVELNAAVLTPTDSSAKIKYGYSNSASTVPTTWQDSTTFSGLHVGDTLYFYAKVEGTSSYAEKVSAASVAVPVADKAAPTITTLPTASVTYGDAVADSALTGGVASPGGTFHWMSGVTDYGDAGTKTLKAKFVPTDTAAYATVENIDVAVTVSAKALTDVAVEDIAAQAYTGSQITPAVEVKGDGGKKLVKDKDYTVDYGANNTTGTGAGTVTVKAKADGNYTFGNVVKHFDIQAGSADDTLKGKLKATHTPYTGPYDGTAHPAFSSIATLPIGWTSTYSRTEAGPYGTLPMITNVADSGKIYVKFSHASYADFIAEYEVKITQKSISDMLVTLDHDSFAYDGTDKTVAVTSVKTTDGAVTLTPTSDYTIDSGSSTMTAKNVPEGAGYPVVVAGTGNYTGTHTVYWKITKADPNAADFDIPSSSAPVDYNGDPISVTPPTLKTGKTGAGTVTVYYKGTSGTTYSKDTNPPTEVGTYDVTFNVADGTNYNAASGLHYGTLTIQAKDVTGLTAVIGDQTTAKGEGQFVDPVIKGVKGETLEGTLTYAYGSETDKTHAEVVTMLATKDTDDAVDLTYTFIPTSTNYTGTKTGTFKVTVKDIAFTVDGGSTADASNAINELISDTTYGATWNERISLKPITATVGTDTKEGTYTIIPDSGALTDRPGVSAGNYTVKFSSSDGAYTDVTVFNGSITVTAKPVTVSGITASSKPYDGNTNATVNASTATITGKVDGDDLTVDASSASATFDNKNVDTDKTVTFTGYSLSGTDAGNYTLATTGNQTEAKADITARTLSITDAAVSNKPYDGNTTATVTDVTFGNLVVGESLTVGTDYTVSGVFNSADAATDRTVTVTVTLNDTVKNYALPTATFAKTGVSINKIDHPTYGTTQTGGTNALRTTAGEKTYNLPCSELAGFAYTVTAKTTANIVADVDPTIAGTVLTYTSKVCAAANETDTITIKIESTNYNDITLTLTVTATDKTPVTISGLTATTGLTYNGSAQTGYTGTASYSPAWSGTPVVTYYLNDGTTKTTTANSGAAGEGLAPKNAGNYKVTIAIPDSDSAYTGNATLNFTIAKRTISVKADNKSMTVNGTLPAFTVSYGDFASGDSEANVIETKATASCTADGTSTGSFPITVSGTTTLKSGMDTNYQVGTPENGTLTVNPAYSGGGGSYTPSYTVSVDKTENGTITVSPKSASKGDTVTITVKPDKGYELEMLKALDKNGDALKLTEKNGKYTFTMPAGKVTVKGSFVEEVLFDDVKVGDYFYEAVRWAVKGGITNGVGNDLFAPNQPCTRGQIVTFLWRAAGSPEPKNMSSFADVPADAFYAKAVAWAVENAITGGTGDGKFSPDATCTRAQSVTFLYRAAGSPKVSGSAEFGDVATNAYYADAVAWAAKNGITGGIGGGLFGSGNDCTRAQIVTFLYRSVK